MSGKTKDPMPEQWKSLARPGFNRDRKKLPSSVLQKLNEEMARVLQDPYKGDRKRGRLSHIWVEKFRAQNDEYLRAYEIVDKTRTVIFAAIGQHENYYRDLEKYLKSIRTGQKPRATGDSRIGS